MSVYMVQYMHEDGRILLDHFTAGALILCLEEFPKFNKVKELQEICLAINRHRYKLVWQSEARKKLLREHNEKFGSLLEILD